jgi:uncharacterized SAM-binding protein YcdF (DUF218 family)
VTGILLIAAVVLSFTDIPFHAYYWLGTHNAGLDAEPDLIVLLGGGGMPSADGLLRCYSAAAVAAEYPGCDIIIAIPQDTALAGYSPEKLMAKELFIRGIDSSRFVFESQGINTFTQVLNIRKMFTPDALDTLVIRIVTSPEHMLRSVKVFRKNGFRYVGGQPTFEKDIREEMLRKKSQTGDIRQAPAVSLRYNMWNYLKYEITVLREYCAIAYYKLRGWI